MRGALSVSAGGISAPVEVSMVGIGWAISFVDGCGRRTDIRIVSGDQTSGNLVGTRSPLGVRLAKRPLAVGDCVSYPTPTGQRMLTVTGVRPTR